MGKHLRHTPRQKSRYISAIGLFTFLASAFHANETFYKSRTLRRFNQFTTRKPLTDLELAREIVSHFPDQWRLLEMPVDKYYGFWPTVNYYRGRYNRGRLTSRQREIPPLISFRYDSNMRRVSERSGKRILTPSEIAARIITHEAKRQDANYVILLGS